MDILWADFETRSKRGLKSSGTYNYMMDASTEIICMSYAFNDEEVATWRPDSGQILPARIVNFRGQIRAHNAAFERLAFWYLLQINFFLEQFYCTATQARANCAPGALEDIGRFASSDMRKDYRGAELIRLLCIPQPDGTFNKDPQLLNEMVAYCEQDVRVMRTISKALRQLTDDELTDYHVNERINDRGITVDVDLARAAIAYAGQEQKDIEQLVIDITNGAIKSVRSPKMREWVTDRVGPEALKMMTIYKNGEKKYSIDKNIRANLLVLADENPDEVPCEVADVIQCADDIWASSVAKFNKMSTMADDEDHRVRGAFVFNGGQATGRASSFGLQVHNFTRKCAKEPQKVREAMVARRELVPEFGVRITDVLKGMLRPALLPAKGKQLVVADWSSIEARITPWASNQASADELLEMYRNNQDTYIREAANIYRVPEAEIDKEDPRRQDGKVAILACGFLGGKGALLKMAKAHAVALTENDAIRIVNAWRKNNQWAVAYGYELEAAYTKAMRYPDQEFYAGRIAYMFDGLHLWYALPSGRILNYPYAAFNEEGNITYAKASWKPKAGSDEWPRATLWKGLACENITQATANCLLRDSLREMERWDLNVVLHCHDEIVVESDHPERDSEIMEEIMLETPEWANDLPMAVEVSIMDRYGK